MLAATTFLLSLAITSAVLPVNGLTVKTSGCDLTGVKIAGLPATLPAPTSPLSFVAVAIGTQNYTCSSAGTFTNVGAVAELFDISCLAHTDLFPTIQDQAMGLWKAAPPVFSAQQILSLLHGMTTPLILGQHYFVPNPLTGQGVNPKWDFTSQGATAGNKDAFVVAAKTAGAAAPTGSQDIDWVDLSNITGSLAKQVYRTDTRLGQPPASCKPGSPDIAVKYASKYWLFGSTLAPAKKY